MAETDAVADDEDASATAMVLVGPGGSHAFSPASLTVSPGTTVRWFFDSAGHTVTSGAEGVADGQFCSPSNAQCAMAPTLPAGTIYEHTFATPGTFSYFCIPHYGVGMKATVTVQ